MKKSILLVSMIAFLVTSQSFSYEKKSLVERYTNCSCGPCATLNNAWYNATVAGLMASGLMNHIVYNVDWPSPTDPMFLLNSTDNITRWTYYGVNSVPWVQINGINFNTASGSAAFTNTINSGNSQYSPFSIEITPERFSNDVINVHIKIIRDPSDITTFPVTKLKVALTEKTVAFPSPPGNNGESVFYSISRKMLPDGKGTELLIPAPGDSVEFDFLYVPTSAFKQAVNIDSIRVVAFIQNESNKQIYQSASEDLRFSNRLNSAFLVEETLGASPFQVNFSDYSTATDSSNLVSWEWDFDNDGTIDSYEQNPTFTFTGNQAYSVALTVSDGNTQHTRVLENFITSVTAASNILVVNGIDYSNATYIPEMTNFYNSSACFGDHQVDVWDLFGDQGFDYMANSNIMKAHLFNRSIPNSILNLYDNVIWIGNNYSGDINYYNPDQVLEYVQGGKNFLLATRLGSNFFNTALRNYCGVTSMSGDLTITQLIALDDSLVNMASSTTGHSLVHLALLGATSEATPIFDEDPNTIWNAGFRIKKADDGAFIYIAGRPYRFDNQASYANYDYIIDNWMTLQPTGVDAEDGDVPDSYLITQNYPNPFNPSTLIRYQLPEAGKVVIKVYDILGNEVSTLVDQYKQSGAYSVRFDARYLSSGIYFYSIQANDFSSTKKMILLK